MWADNTGVERIPKSESAQKVDPREHNFPAAPAGNRTRDLSVVDPEFGALTTDLSPLPCHFPLFGTGLIFVHNGGCLWICTYQASLWGDTINMSRDPALWYHRSAAKGAYTPYCGWIVVSLSRLSLCVTVACVHHWYLHLSSPPSLSSLPPGTETRELDPMFVNLNTEGRNLYVCLYAVSTFSWRFPTTLVVIQDAHDVQRNQ